eukprot:scaffold610_cov352-Pavlova_lutheri.AAC.2
MLLSQAAAECSACGVDYGVHSHIPTGQVLVEDARTIEHARHVFHLASVPTTYVLIEAGGSSKHVFHVNHLASFPITYVVVEAVGTIEHEPHVRHLAGVPLADVLVEAGGKSEHALHNGHLAGVPPADVLVEVGGSTEHGQHVAHIAGVPAPDVLIKRVGLKEHKLHVRHLAGVPLADVLVEAGGFFEHGFHTGHLAGVPGGDVLIEGAGAVEQFTHVRDPGRAGGGKVRIVLIGNLQCVQAGSVAFGVAYPVHHAGFAHVGVGTQYGHAVGGPKKQARTITCEGLLEARSDEQEQGQERGRRGHGGCVVWWRATTPNLPALLRRRNAWAAGRRWKWGRRQGDGLVASRGREDLPLPPDPFPPAGREGGKGRTTWRKTPRDRRWGRGSGAPRSEGGWRRTGSCPRGYLVGKESEEGVVFVVHEKGARWLGPLRLLLRSYESGAGGDRCIGRRGRRSFRTNGLAWGDPTLW